MIDELRKIAEEMNAWPKRIREGDTTTFEDINEWGAALTAWIDKWGPFVSAAMENCAAWENGDVGDSALDPFQRAMRAAYRAAKEKNVAQEGGDT